MRSRAAAELLCLFDEEPDGCSYGYFIRADETSAILDKPYK